MNILGVFIVTLSWGFIRATTYSEGWTDQKYHQLPGVPDRPLAYQHLPSRILAKLPDEQRIYQNWIENNRAPQIAHPSPIQQSSNINSLPLRPQLNEESHVLAYINEPYNLPHQNQVKEFSISGTRNIENTPVLQEPYRQNVELQEIAAPNAKYIQQTPESVSYLKRNQEVSNSSLRQKLGVQHIFSNPNIREVLNKTKQTKRYMVIYPDGRVSHVDNIDAVLESNPQHIFISSKELSQNRFDANFLQQTENTKEQNKIVNDVHGLKKIATEQKVAHNPIDLILNETIPTSQSKSAEKLESKPIIVVQSFIQRPNNQIQSVDSPPGINKVKKINSENTKVTSNEISQSSNLSQSGNYNSSNETFTTFNTSNMQPYTDSMIREEKNNGLNKTEVDLSSTLNTENLQPYIHQTYRVEGEQGNFTNTSNQDSSNETYTTFNSSNLHPYTGVMIREQKNNGLNETSVDQNSTLNISKIQPYIDQTNIVEVDKGNFPNTSNQESSNKTYTTFNSSNKHPYTDAMVREDKNNDLNETGVSQNSIFNTLKIQPYINKTNRVEVDQGNFANTSNQDSSNETYTTFNSSNKHPYTDAMIREDKNNGLNKTDDGQSSTLNTSNSQQYINQSNVVEVEQGNLTNTSNQEVSNETYTTFDSSNLHLYTDAATREEKDKGLNENSGGQNSTSVTLDTANIQPHRESDQGNFTETSTLVNKTSEYKIQADKSDIDPVNSNEHISPILNNTDRNGNSQASNKTVIEPQPKQSQIVEQTTLQNKTNASVNKINKVDNNLTSDILEQKTDKLSENKSSVTSSSVVQETSKPKSEEQDFNSKTLDNETNPNDSSSDPIQPSDNQENTEKHNKEQNSSENQTEINNSTGDSDDATSKTQEETGLHNNSSNQNETHYSDFVLSLEETDSGDNFDFWESSTSWEVDPEGEVTSEEGDAWKKLTIKKDDFDVVLKLDLPLQPITVVDTNGEEHACVLLLDPTASLSYIICK